MNKLNPCILHFKAYADPFYGFQYQVANWSVWVTNVKFCYLSTIAGGQSSLADYCTYFVAYSDGSCTDTNSARAPDRMLGEVRGGNSRSDFWLELS